MELKEFQLNAVKSLFEAMDKPVRDIILKSPTGSGKTIILTYFMHQYIQSYPKTVFVWLTPGKGNLEEQSKAKMDKYIHASQTKLLSDVMTAGFEENDSCFINWEKLTKKGNNALKDSERTNFLEHIEHALNDGLRFIIIVDESHQNNTIKADEIIQYGAAILDADGIVEPPHGAATAPKVSEFAGLAERGGVPNHMIVNVSFVDMGADNVGVIAFGEALGQLTAQTVRFLRCDLSGNKGLPQMVGDHIILAAHSAGLLDVLIFGEKELGVGDPAIALPARN